MLPQLIHARYARKGIESEQLQSKVTRKTRAPIQVLVSSTTKGAPWALPNPKPVCL